MPMQPDQPFGGAEYPPIEQQPPPRDPYAPVDYPPLPPPLYPEPGGGYPPPPPGYPSAYPPPYPAYPSPYPGHPPYPYDPYQFGKPPGTNSKAIASLITSLVGLPFCGLPAVAGVILGLVAMRETKSTGQEGQGIALAGTIVGALVVAFWFMLVVFAAVNPA